MNKWIQMAIKERKVTFLISILLLLYGVYAYYYIPKQENPDTSSPVAQIITVFPGATAAEVEQFVSKKIEDELSTLDGVEYITSYSNPNVSVVLISLNYEVDYEKQWTKMRNLLDGLRSSLPSGVLDYHIQTDLTDSAGIIISMSGEAYSYEQLSAMAQHYKRALEQVDGIKRVVIEGAPEKEIVVKLNIDKLNALPLSNKDVLEIIMAQNVAIPSGDLQTPYGKLALKSPKGFETLTDIENIMIYGSQETGAIVRLKDIASVQYDYPSSFQKYKTGADNAVLLTAYFKPNQNVVLIGNTVRETMDTLRLDFPEDLNLTEVIYQPNEVNTAITDFMLNLLQGVGFVILVVLFGMGIRNATVVSTAIPLSIAATLAIMYTIGIDIQQMSIAALIIALGILVDNSIVISDAIQVKLNEGMAPYEASYQGASESSIPVLTSTLTTVAAFAPLMVLPGEAGEFAKSLPAVVIIALIASYLVAMFVTPAMASKFFKTQRVKKHVSKSLWRRIFESTLKGALKYRLITYVSILVIAALTGYAVTFLTIELFPYADKDLVYIDVFCEKKGDIIQTEQLTEDLYKILEEYPEVGVINRSIGGGFPKFYLTVGVRPPSDDYAQLMFEIDLTSSEFSTREAFAYALQQRLDDELIGGTAGVNLLEINQPGPAIDIKVSGLLREDVELVSEEVFKALLEDPRTIQVKSDQAKRVYQYSIDVNDNKAGAYGMTKYDIQYQINLALNGMTATRVQIDENAFDVVVKSDVMSIEDVLNMAIQSSFTREKVLLKQFANITLEDEWSSIKRHNRLPSVSVSADVRPGYSASALQAEIEKDILGSLDLRGIYIDFGGDKEVFDKYISGLIGAAIIAVAVIYLILLIQFNSLIQPVIILISVPLSVIGSVFILLIFNMNVTFTVGLGVASLIGIVVNNAILLIEYINRERKEGIALYEACIHSVDKRFRPIMLSTITTIIGLVPLALSRSSFFTPMALALMGGLMVSTVLTLIIVPVIYYAIEKRLLQKSV